MVFSLNSVEILFAALSILERRMTGGRPHCSSNRSPGVPRSDTFERPSHVIIRSRRLCCAWSRDLDQATQQIREMLTDAHDDVQHAHD
jgi:hypothetical protein